MSAPHNGNWHAANGGLPFRRAPTVDEALAFSPFTSIVPFSPDIIPFPSSEPPSPASTLTDHQLRAAKQAEKSLSDEAKGTPTTSQQLQQTLQALKSLLNPSDLSQFHFKPAAQLATPPPESATAPQNNGVSSARASLSPFASLLLESTDVSFLLPGEQGLQRTRSSRDSTVAQLTPQSASRPAQHAQSTPLNRDLHARPTPTNHHLPATPSGRVNPPLVRSGPAVIVKPLPPSARLEEYRRFDAPETSDTLPKKKQRAETETPAVKSRETELAERKMNELYSLLAEVVEARDTDQPGFFTTLDTDDGELPVLQATTLSRLSEAVERVVNLGCFSSVPTKKVLLLQSLCEPLISATAQLSLDIQASDAEDLVDRLAKAQLGLRACRLVLQTMTEGSNDRRLCSEDLVQAIIHLLKHVFNSCIMPVVESRRTGSLSELFALVGKHKSNVYTVLRLCGNTFTHIAALIGQIRLSGITLSPIESVSIEIIFAQNGEKETESALGIQKFESFRQKAMDVLAQIFACHLEQRGSITNDILLNLEKLPDKRASARNFKSARESPIMLVSALFMRMVQATASNNSDKNATAPTRDPQSEEDDSEEDSDSDGQYNHPKKPKPANKSGQAPREVAARLGSDASIIAGTIASRLINRAENVSKSGDKPFRNLLDLFIEDLCNVLGSPEWPASSIFLEKLLALMLPFAQNYKEKGVQAADMALAAMGSMGVGIIDFTIRLRHVKRNLDISQSELASRLVPLADDALKGSINSKDVVGLNGPYRVVLESLPGYLNLLGSQSNRDDPHLRSLTGYYATFWVNAFYKAFEDSGEGGSRHPSVHELEKHLKNVIMDPNWFSKEYNFQEVTDAESQLAAGIITLQEPFCKYLEGLISRLLNNTQSPSAKVKSRAMNSLVQMIEKDPQILDDKSFPGLARLIGDNSPMVRENTISLISKCLEQNPSLERHCLPGILNLMTDPANGPKKKAIKLLKDIYMSTAEQDKKVRIATELLLPILDDDKPISDLTRQTLEDIWLAPLRSPSRVDENQLKLDRENRISLLIITVQNIQARSAHLQAFEAFFKAVLSPTGKNPIENFKICKEMVADMVEGVISTDSTVAEKSQARILQTLSVFAKVSPKLFTADQVQLLKLYVKNLVNSEDLAVFQPTVIIFRFVFPVLSSLREAFLDEVRDSLVKVTGKLAAQASQGHVAYKQTLLDIAHCLWIISPLVKGDPPHVKSGMEKLAALVCSAAVQLETVSSPPPENKPPEKAAENRILSLLILLGVFGKVCNFDEHVEMFRAQVSKATQTKLAKQSATADQMKRVMGWKSPSFAVLLLDLILPFTRQAWNMRLREQALCSIGEICQQKTKHFTRADIEKAFKLPFINKDASLIRVVLTQFRDFLATAEHRSETGAEIAVGEGAVHGAERLETSFNASDNDHATTHIARTFLPQIIDTALGKAMDLALPATEILVSISRQGLLHPKECGAALVALSTSLMPQISLKASAEQEKIHLQHETMFEKEYVSAVTLAFRYQRDVFDDPRGALEATFKPKMQLLFEAFKKGSRKTLKKFITNLLGQIDFELSKLDATGTIPDHILFARFCLENCALFDYARVDDVIHVILSIESIVLKQTGPSVALAIESEMAEQQYEQPAPAVEAGGPSTDLAPQDLATHNPTEMQMTEERLRQLTTASIVLQMMWETRTFLRRAYNLQGKITAKDMLRPATRINFITGKDLWDRFTSLPTTIDTTEAMKKQCSDFAEIINVDREHAVGEDEDGDAREQLAKVAAGYETPDENEGGDAPAPTSGKGRKRKGSAGLANTPKKPRGRASGGKAKAKRNSRTPDDSE